jgi:hypothetical protein
MRMNDNRTLKRKILNTKLDGIRRVGRPKMRWKDGVNQDMRTLEVKNWKKVAHRQRRMGQSFLRRPGTTKGCRVNDDDDDDAFQRAV